ncbi:MAG: methyl-coenzyme M reductase operon protein D [Methermicoccaceae archaeon]
MPQDTQTEAIQIEIAPNRLLFLETTQKLLSQIVEVEGVERVLILGERLPTYVPSGPATGVPVEHHERGVIQVGDELIELIVQAGRIRLELESRESLEQIKAICDRTLPFGYRLEEGLFFPKKATLTDYAKLGQEIDEKLLGMTDPDKRAHLDGFTVVEKDEKEE